MVQVLQLTSHPPQPSAGWLANPFPPDLCRARSHQNFVRRGRSVDKYVCSIRKISAAMGDHDYRYNRMVQLYLLLGGERNVKQGNPPTRLHPLPVFVLLSLGLLFQAGREIQQAVIDLIWVAFLYNWGDIAEASRTLTTTLSASTASNSLLVGRRLLQPR